MASAPLTGSTVLIYAKSPEGHKYLVTKGSTEYFGAGGSPDGVPASKVDQWVFLPQSKLTLTGGWKVLVSVILGSADGVDVSDSACQLPIHVRGVGVRHLSSSDLGGQDLAAATTTIVEHDFGTGYTVPDGQQVRIGGAKIWFSVENDA